MDSYKDIAPDKGANDSTRISTGESAAAKMLSETGFIKAEPFYINPPASEKPRKKLLLEDYNKDFDGFGGFRKFDREPKSKSDNPVFREFDNSLQKQLEELRNDPRKQLPASESKPESKQEKPPERQPEKMAEPEPESEPKTELGPLATNADRAHQASLILNNNWQELDFDGNNAISKEEVSTAARRYEGDPVKGVAIAYLRDNFDVVRKLYKTEFRTASNSISQSDMKFLGDLSRAAIQDNYYHEKANNYLKEHFDQIDTDGSGTLSGEELGAAEEKTEYKSPEKDLLRYALIRQREDYSDPRDVGFEYDADKVNPTEIKREDLDMTLAERLAKSREDIFVQNYYKMYGYVGGGVGFLGAAALIMAVERRSGSNNSQMGWRMRNSILGGGVLLGQRVGGYVDRFASRRYFHKHQEANLKNLLDTTTGSF